MSVVFLNTQAKLLLYPTISTDDSKGASSTPSLKSVLRFKSAIEFQGFNHMLRNIGGVHGFGATLLNHDGSPLSVRIFANRATLDDVEYAFVYLMECGCAASEKNDTDWEVLEKILNFAHHGQDMDESIRSILALAGQYAKVSRVYVFEDISSHITRNTYEWCAAGIKPAIQDLQNLRKEDYSYDVIMESSGMMITEDTRRLAEKDRHILEDLQGIKSIAILPLFYRDTPLGYIGFDDCVQYRKWSMGDINLLKSMAGVVAALINRRNTTNELRHSREMMQTITDNLQDLVCLSDIATHELKFASQSLVDAINVSREDIIGKPCWRVLQPGQNGPCPFCPVPKLFGSLDDPRKEPLVWEFKSERTNKWYLIKSTVIKWTDGTPMHLETAVDITYRKKYEEQLKRAVATDRMTEVYNREWGHNKLKELFREAPAAEEPKTLCFMDIDDLKSVNDRFGHAAGDELIINTIKVIYSCIRKDDFVCRWGGDEFIMLLHCGMRFAAKVMEKIEFAMAHFNQSAGKPYRLSMSYGLADFRGGEGEALEQIIHSADTLMYANKARKQAQRYNTSIPR